MSLRICGRAVRIRTHLILLVTAGVLACLALILVPGWYLSETREYQDVSIMADGYQLHSYLSRGAQDDSEWILFIHGNRKSGQDHPLYVQIRNNLPKRFSVLAIDLRGFGRSADASLGQAPKILDRSSDILAATRHLREQYGIEEDDIILIGHSLGAAQVFHLAQSHHYRLVIPIGLGYWDGVMKDEAKMKGYIARFANNTGVRLSEEQLQKEGSYFTSQALLSTCPRSPVWMIFADRDEARQPLYPDFQRLEEVCGDRLRWSTIPFADHVYGTELTWTTKPLQTIYSNLVGSLLKWRLLTILNQYTP